jgi:spore coat polysaccharide biosynthesis protein SpsF
VHTVAIVQARMTSTRLPGKVMADVSGRPILARIVERLRAAKTIDEIVIATTTNDADDIVVDLVDKLETRWYRGDEHDVLGRYVGAAVESDAEVVVRVTGDCPLIDPVVVDLVSTSLKRHSTALDLACNTVVPSYPIGLAVEAVYRDALHRIDRMAYKALDREHVLLFATHTEPTLFRRHEVAADSDDSDIRLTVDYPADLDVVRKVYESLDLDSRTLPYQDVVQWLRIHPEITEHNRHLHTWHPDDDFGQGGNR